MAMTFDQAMDVLERMKNAAPPIAASKLTGVIELLQKLQTETGAQPHDPLPQAFSLTPPPEPARPPISRPVISPEPTQKTPPPFDDEAGTSPLLRRTRKAKPAEPPVPPPRETKVLDEPPSPKKRTTNLFEDLPDRSVLDDYPFDPVNFADLFTKDQLPELPDTGDLFRDLPDFGEQQPDDLRNFDVDAMLGIRDSSALPADNLFAEIPDYADDPNSDTFDLDAVIYAAGTGSLTNSYDDLPDFEESADDQQNEDVNNLFAELPNGRLSDDPLEALFGNTNMLPDYSDNDIFSGTNILPDYNEPVYGQTNMLPAYQDPGEGYGSTAMLPPDPVKMPSFDDIPDLFGDVADDEMALYHTIDERLHNDHAPHTPDLFGATNFLIDQEEEQLFGATQPLPDMDAPPNSVLAPDEGVYALDDLVRFASSAADDTPQAVPSATALLTNMNEALKPSLMLLRTQAEILQARVAGAGSGDEANVLRMMRDNAETALKLLNSLEQVMQLSDGSLRLALSEFSCVPLLREAGMAMQEQARSRRHRITVQLDGSLPPLVGDYKRLLAILIDLMDNAVRYTPTGGSSRIAVEMLGTHVLFTIADTGIGLTADDINYIGQPFWRATHQTLVRQQPGTGLRLYLARRVVEMHGGELYYSGEPDMGSTFSFTIPVAS